LCCHGLPLSREHTRAGGLHAPHTQHTQVDQGPGGARGGWRAHHRARAGALYRPLPHSNTRGRRGRVHHRSASVGSRTRLAACLALCGSVCLAVALWPRAWLGMSPAKRMPCRARSPAAPRDSHLPRCRRQRHRSGAVGDAGAGGCRHQDARHACAADLDHPPWTRDDVHGPPHHGSSQGAGAVPDHPLSRHRCARSRVAWWVWRAVPLCRCGRWCWRVCRAV
jgi:hypothetical protein